MSPAVADRNLLFGILALQMDFIGRQELIAAMNAWVLDKSQPLGSILVRQGALEPSRHTLLDALVSEHIKQHDNNAEKSLAAVGTLASVRHELESLADPDVARSVGHVSSGTDSDPQVLPTLSVGAPTSPGSRFRILRPHARGGLGEVFVARDEELRREVALKEIQARLDNPESRARFLLEAEITGQLEHPGIVPVYGLGQYADGRPFYAMRFIRGESLKEAIERYHGVERGEQSAERETSAGAPRSALDTPRTLEFRQLLGRFIDVCNAIQYAHDRGVLHRDLKPGNIMLGKYGETLVVDWGLAKTGVRRPEAGTRPVEPVVREWDLGETTLRPEALDGSAETIAGSALGTPQFMSPEQAAGRLDLVGPASDVYSLGATLYSVLTGRPPFQDGDAGELLKRVQRGEFSQPRQLQPDTPAALEAICLKAMAPTGKDRYPSPRALADDIEHWLADEPVSAWPEPATVKLGRWVRRHRPLVSGAAAALFVGLVTLTLGIIWYEGERAEAARKLELTEQAVHKGLDQVQETRAQLRADLAKPGGVQDLLNQPARWEIQLKTARAEWKNAKALADGADGNLDPELTAQLQGQDQDLKRDQADYELARRLEKIRVETAVWVLDRFDYAHAMREYPRAFRDGGLEMKPQRQQQTADGIKNSAIKEQLLMALDHWAWVAQLSKEPKLRDQVLAVARRADPDPWRDRLRNPVLWGDRKARDALTQELERDQAAAGRLTPQMLLLIGGFMAKDKKAAWLRSARELHPADFWLNFDLAHTLALTNDRDAAGFYRVALTIRPNTAAVYNNIGMVFAKQGDRPAAIAAYKKAVAIDPKLAYAWNNLGSVRLDQGNPAGAIEAYKTAVSVMPKYGRAWHNYGLALQSARKLPEAAEAFRKAAAYEPKFAQAWRDLGVVLRDQKNLPGAIDAYKKAVKVNPRYVLAWKDLGAALRDDKNLPAAIAAYRKALALEPKNAEYWSDLGDALRDNARKDLPAAITAYKKAVSIEPHNETYWQELGDLFFESKDLPAAVHAYRKSLAIDPSDGEVWNNLGRALYQRKQIPQAMEAYREAVRLDQGERFNAARRLILAAAGKSSGKLDVKARSQSRHKALAALEAELAERAKLLEKKPTSAVPVYDSMQHWQSDPDLSSVRASGELTNLAADERSGWERFWERVKKLQKQARSYYEQTEERGKLGANKEEQVHTLRMTAGNTYVIDMISLEFDTYLRLEDEQGKKLVENDDASASNQNARVEYTVPAGKTGVYRIVAGSFENRGVGAYTITTRTFPVRKP